MQSTANVKAEKSNTLEAASLARVAEAAREMHAASAAIEAHSTAVGERQASALKVTRLTAAIQELEDAGLAFAAVIDDVNRRVHKERRLSAEAGARLRALRTSRAVSMALIGRMRPWRPAEED